MNPALEMLADHLSRLDTEELQEVCNRAYELVKERDWRSGDDFRHACEVTALESWEEED